ncbi:MAG: aminopeptidase [Xanthomonadales bacterium]|nr:aminopeptidase [Xanthomonadales bacterium]NIT32773.1 aminopeptidase [Xanthomonadales bacterium]
MRARPARNDAPVRVLLACGLMLAAGLGACAGPGYYLQAVSGHWQLMRSREDVATLLTDPGLDPQLRGRLELAAEVVAFAAEALDLPADGSYAQYAATGREAVVWNVVAAPEFSLEPRKWCFPIAGCVPYRGYFDRDQAGHAARRLAARGDDVAVVAAIAYSTLGWFHDPLLDTMLAHPDAQLAGILVHELAHQRLYLRGDAAFNEAYARFVERRGVARWLERTGQAQALEEWRARLAAADQFQALLRSARDALERLYALDIDPEERRAAKRSRLDRLHADYAELRSEEWQGRDDFGAWFAAPVNNARLALLSDYEGGHCAFSALLQQAGGDFARFNRLAETRAALAETERRAWLETPCHVIASDPDL